MRLSFLKKYVIIFVALLTGCRSIGPAVLHNDRYNYNLAMNYTSKQELLLNIVRLRYDDAPMVLRVGNISGSTRISHGGSLSGRLFFPASGTTSGDFGGNASIDYSDNPIISYTPMDNKDFTTQFLGSLELYDLGLLLQSSWSLPRVFRVTLQQAGTAVNAPSSARATSSHVPKYQNFIDMVYVLRRMQLADAITVFYARQGPIEELMLVISKNFKLTPKERATLKKAGVEIYQDKIIFTNTPQPHKVYVITRSMLGILNYLSKGIIVPPIDAKKRILTQTTYPDGKLFDWQSVLRGMMKIHWSDSKPSDAAVAISYRGHWYYISDSDADSKQTLILLANISGLIETSPPGSDATPTLTRGI